MPKDNLDPLFADILGTNEIDDGAAIAGESTSDADDFDPVANLRHEIEYGISAPGTNPAVKKLSVVDISDALNKVRQAIGGSGKYAERLRKLNLPLEAMAASASEYLPEGSPAIEFLQGAADGDDDAMKRALRRMASEDAPAN